jgi:hypothetical protein
MLNNDALSAVHVVDGNDVMNNEMKLANEAAVLVYSIKQFAWRK